MLAAVVVLNCFLAVATTGQGHASRRAADSPARAGSVPQAQLAAGLELRASALHELRWPCVPASVVPQLHHTGTQTVSPDRLARYPAPEVTDETGVQFRVSNWIELQPWTPWVLQLGGLEGNTTITWTQSLQHIRFVEPPMPGQVLELRFRLPVRDPQPEDRRVTPPLRLVLSNPVYLTVTGGQPPTPGRTGDLPSEWDGEMFCSYSENNGWGQGRRLLIDGAGRAVFQRTRGDVGGPVPGSRHEGTLAKKSLEDLLHLIRQEGLWEPAKYRESILPDEGCLRIMLIWRDGWFLRTFPDRIVQGEPGPGSLQKLMDNLIATL